MRLRNAPRLALATVLAAALAASGCADLDSPGGGEAEESITVIGDIQNESGEALPSDARLLLVWTVTTSSTDYDYVYGEGTIDASAGTFTLALSEPPPAAALNAGIVGVGLLIVTTNQEIGTGDSTEGLEAEILGASPRYAVIWRVPGASGGLDWVDAFDSGYGVGIGKDIPDDFDIYEPSISNEMTVIIDDLSNMDFVDWT